MCSVMLAIKTFPTSRIPNLLITVTSASAGSVRLFRIVTYHIHRRIFLPLSTSVCGTVAHKFEKHAEGFWPLPELGTVGTTSNLEFEL